MRDQSWRVCSPRVDTQEYHPLHSGREGGATASARGACGRRGIASYPPPAVRATVIAAVIARRGKEESRAAISALLERLASSSDCTTRAHTCITLSSERSVRFNRYQ